ncbi:molecular chaperone DjiA [PVC group bacterium]|nr:molecular chaperone DjiA [PVC group bacterium]
MDNKEQRYSNQPGCFIMLLLLALMFGGARLFLILFGLMYILFPLLVIAIPVIFLVSSMRRKSTIQNYINTQTQDHNRFVELFVRILARMVQADGVVDPHEIAAIRKYFQYQMRLGSEQLQWIKDILKDALKKPDSVEDLCREFNASFGYEPKLVLCDLLYRVAFADGEFDKSEQDLLRDIVALLGIHEHHHKSIRGQYVSGEDDQRYYEILGLEPGADFEGVRDAYKKMSQQFHPDKVTHLGPEFARVAEDKMKLINEAYQYLKKKLV